MKVALLVVLVVVTAPVWSIFAAIFGLAVLVLLLKPVEWLVKWM